LGVVDSVIAKTDEVIVKTERLKKGLMQTLLTRGIGHKEFKETEIGKIPKTWQVVSLGDVCEQRSEIVQPSANNKEPFVGLEHIASGETRLRNFAQSTDVKSAKFRFYAGDILYGKLRPYLDKAVLADLNGICSTDLLVLKPKNNVIKEFLIYVLHSTDFIKHAIATTTGTNHPRTSWTAISKFKFGLPEHSEQQNIANILSTIDRKLELEKKEKVRLERIKRGLMDLLLTGKIRVKVDCDAVCFG
jgi:type I restriction enzyme S subunit